MNSPRPNWREEDRRPADRMSSYWFNFAAHGDPNGRGLPPWPAFVAGDAELALELGPMTPVAVIDAERAAIFAGLYRAVYGE